MRRMFTENQIKDIVEKASEGKVNLIETEDIVNVLDTVKVGDVVVVGNQVYIINYVDRSEYPYSVSVFLIDGESDAINYINYAKGSGKDWFLETNDQIFPVIATKLYKHGITMTAETGNVNFIVISLSNVPLTIKDLQDGLYSNLSNGNIISISAENNSDAWSFSPYYLVFDDSDNSINATLAENIPNTIDRTFAFVGTPTLTDTVTPL